MIAGAELLPVLKPEKPASTNPANEVAKKLTGRDYVSWSALSTFRTCPLKYKFRYVDGLPEESVSSARVWQRDLFGHRAALPSDSRTRERLRNCSPSGGLE